MLYTSLNPDQKRAIDALHEAMMQHKRTILQVSTMAPKLLQPSPQQADVAAGQELPLATVTSQLKTEVHQLQLKMKAIQEAVDRTKQLYEIATVQAVMFAKWPTEAVAMRRGVHLSKQPASESSVFSAEASMADTQAQIQRLLDRQLVRVDRLEHMPSPYLWQLIDDMESRLSALQNSITILKQQLENSKRQRPDDIHVTSIMQMQEEAIYKLVGQWTALQKQVEKLRSSYRLYEKGDNVLELADQAERDRQQQLEHQLRLQMVKVMPATAPAPAPTQGGGLFGSTAPAPGGSLFGTPAPAPSGGLFGSFGAPAPATGGLFGSATTTGLFGITPAPAPGGGLFGSTAPAPAPGGLFGTSSTPAPATGGLFGTTTSAAPAFTATTPATPAFGSTPAPAAFSFGSTGTTTSTTSSTPKAKNKSRSSRRR